MSPDNQIPTPSVADVLASYRRYISGLDDFCMKLREKYWESMVCRPGCTDCCSQELTVFPIEAAGIRIYVESLAAARRDQIKGHVKEYRTTGKTSPCAFLLQGRCLVYPARALLCRTEGFILAHRGSGDADWSVTACPKNFEKLDLASTVPSEDLINLESLNQSLAVLNHAYVKASGWTGKERVRFSEVLDGKGQEGLSLR